MRTFRYAVLTLALAAPAGVIAQRAAGKPAAPAPQAITVYKTATCGCCTKWVDHLKAAGFNPTVHVVDNMSQSPITKRVPESLRSCHTATLEGYLVEGHVPADVIKQLLRDKPRVEGSRSRGCRRDRRGWSRRTLSRTTWWRSTRQGRRRCSPKGRCQARSQDRARTTTGPAGSDWALPTIFL